MLKNQIRWWLLTILIAVAPFHAFLATWLKIPGFTVWREIFVLLIIIFIIVEIFRRPQLAELKLDVADWLILTFTALSFFWFLMALLSEKDLAIPGWALGFRYDVLPFLFLFFVRRISWPDTEKLMKIFFAGAALVLIFGLLQAVVLPQNFLTNFGYTSYQGEFKLEAGIPACQYVEHTDLVCRAISTFGGPTRYGTYLLLILGMLILLPRDMSFPRRRESIIKSWQISAFAGMTIINIALTFSRSVWIGTLAAGVVAFFMFIPKKITLKISVGLAALLLAGFIGWQIFNAAGDAETKWPPPFVKSFLIRSASSGEHWKLFMEGADIALGHPLGIGLGAAGPASVRLGEKLLTENWYLQIAIEMGWLGLALFLGILAALGRELLRSGQTGLLLTLLGISVAALFTHAFEETTTMLLFAAFAGITRLEKPKAVH